MKIKFIAYWNSDKNIYDYVNDVWNWDNKYDDILTYQNDYTHLVVFNKVYVNFKKENTFGIILESYWNDHFDKNLPNKCCKVFTYQPDKYNTNNLIQTPILGLHRLYDVYDREPVVIPGTTKKILNTTFTKTKKLSIILNTHFDNKEIILPECLYQKREDLAKKLFESDLDFDFYGPRWSITDKRYKGRLINKIDGLKDYKYTVALENTSISGLMTEKIIDSFLCNTIPIYNGHRDVEKYYPNSCEYLEYDGNEIERIKDIINSDKKTEDYDFENAKNTYLNVYNPIKIIKNVIEDENNCS
jgi:hypothetical protein